VQKWSGEETEIGEPSGVTYGEVVVKGHDTIPMEMCIPPRLLKQPEPWTEVEELDESQIRSGEYPPPEVIAEQLSEVHALQPEAEVECPTDGCEWSEMVEVHVETVLCPECEGSRQSRRISVPDEPDNIDGHVTPKEWLDDWYARRFETDREPDTSVTEDDTTDIDEKPPVVEDVERDLERELSEDEMKVAKRIEIVEDAHPDKGVVELSAEYDAIDYMEVVESTLHCVRE